MQDEILELLENLKLGKSKRTQNSLDKLNLLLKDLYFKEQKNFSIRTIGNLSSLSGGIGEVSIRNKTGIHFRVLIDAWVQKVNRTTKKPNNSHSHKKNSYNDFDFLHQIPDPAARAVFGQIIAENKKLKIENNILKSKANITIDMRQSQEWQTNPPENKIEVFTSLKGLLLDSEVSSLKDAISETTILNRGWSITDFGGVQNENNRPIFKPGFITGIKKILSRT